MLIDTRHWFLKVLRPLGVDVVCDIGSLNGADALQFRRVAPAARVLAFEANPENVRLMQAAEPLMRGRIEVFPLAVLDRNGPVEFFVVDAPDPAVLARRGMSSIYARTTPGQEGRPVRVQGTRLDDFLKEQQAADGTLALWIDAEGAAGEVLAGAKGILDRVLAIHVELETTPCIGRDQKLMPEVDAFLLSQGFVRVGTDRRLAESQINAAYLRTRIAPGLARRIRAVTLRAWLRQRIWHTVIALVPRRVRDFLLRRHLTPRSLPKP